MRTFPLALAALALLGAISAAADEDGRIRVIGRAQEERAPDFAAVEVGVQSKGATPASALDAASNAARGIVETAKTMGVPDADIGTSSITLQPVTRTIRQADGGTREQPDGYLAGNRVNVRLSDIGKLGDLMRRTLDAGANRIEGVSFGLRDPAGAQSAVQVAAMRDARAQAERLAEAAGVRIGTTLSITSPARTEIPRPPPFALARAPAPRGRASVPVEAGSIETSAEIEAVFSIAP